MEIAPNPAPKRRLAVARSLSSQSAPPMLRLWWRLTTTTTPFAAQNVDDHGPATWTTRNRVAQLETPNAGEECSDPVWMMMMMMMMMRTRHRQFRRNQSHCSSRRRRRRHNALSRVVLRGEAGVLEKRSPILSSLDLPSPRQATRNNDPTKLAVVSWWRRAALRTSVRSGCCDGLICVVRQFGARTNCDLCDIFKPVT
jgi:hypothetical protein